MTITSGSYSTQNSGNNDVFVKVGNGSILLVGANGKELNINKNVTSKLITLTDSNDYIKNYASEVTINGGDGDDDIHNYADNVLFKYANGDGNDVIYGFKKNSTLSIGGSYSSQKSGNDIIFTVGDGKISLIGAATLEAVNIVGKELPVWKLNSKTATYGTADKTLATVSGVKSVDGLSISGKVVTVAASSLNKKKVSITGDGYTLKLGDDVNAPSTSNKWTISGTTAKYNQTTAAGYKLASDSKSVSYSSGSTKTLATVSGVKSVDGLSISGKVITVAASSLNKKKVSITGDGYTLKLGGDVDKPSTKKAAWTLKSSTATYKSSYKTAGYKLASDGKSISYTKATTAELLATIKGAASKTGLSVSGNKITLKKSALKSKVTVAGAYEFDFTSDYKSATITGSSNDDPITARGSNLSINGGAGDDTIKVLGANTSVYGGAGSDVFIYKSGKSGVITDYNAEDTVSISGGKVSTIKTSGSDVVFDGKITDAGGADKIISYVDSKGKHIHSHYVDFNSKGTAATLKSNYPSNKADLRF